MFLVGEAFDYNDFVKQMRCMAQNHPRVSKSNPKNGIAEGITITGTGAGRLYVTPGASVPTGGYTLTCTRAGSDTTSPLAQFSVVRNSGSVNIGTLTAGRRFVDNQSPSTRLGLILRTTTPWIIGDTIAFTLVAGTLGSQAWIQDRFTEGTEDANGDFVTEWIAHAPTIASAGASPEDRQHFGLQTMFTFATGIYNVRLRGFDGYVSANLYANQTNSSTEKYIHLLDQPMSFWATVNGDRLCAVVKCGSVYEWVYLGWVDVHATGTQHPKPMFVGGMSADSTLSASSIDNNHSAFWDPATSLGAQTSAVFRWVDGTWLVVLNKSGTNDDNLAGNLAIQPFGAVAAGGVLGQIATAQAPAENVRTGFTYLTNRWVPQLGSNRYELMPCTIVMKTPAVNVIGDLIGVYGISGFSQASENTVLDDNSPQRYYVVFQNAFETTRRSFAALRLE